MQTEDFGSDLAVVQALGEAEALALVLLKNPTRSPGGLSRVLKLQRLCPIEASGPVLREWNLHPGGPCRLKVGAADSFSAAS